MTAPLLDQLFRVIEHLDEDWAIPCERWIREPHCDQPAEWLAWSVRCCPDRAVALPICATHKAEILDVHRSTFCRWCGETFSPTLTAFTLIEPLNRRLP